LPQPVDGLLESPCINIMCLGYTNLSTIYVCMCVQSYKLWLSILYNILPHSHYKNILVMKKFHYHLSRFIFIKRWLHFTCYLATATFNKFHTCYFNRWTSQWPTQKDYSWIIYILYHINMWPNFGKSPIWVRLKQLKFLCLAWHC